MTAERDPYEHNDVANTGLVIGFDVGQLERVDPAIIECPPGFCIVPETGEGIPAANEYAFGSSKAWTAALAMTV